MKTSHFIVPAIFTLAASFAVADDHKKFAEVDMDKDGELSSQELRTALPGLQTIMSTTRGSSASSQTAGADATLTREQISRALPGVDFDEESGPIDEQAYEKIAAALEEQSPAGATGRANQSERGAAQSSTNSNSPRATQGGASSSTQGSASGATHSGAASSTHSGASSSTQGSSTDAAKAESSSEGADESPNPSEPERDDQ